MDIRFLRLFPLDERGRLDPLSMIEIADAKIGLQPIPRQPVVQCPQASITAPVSPWSGYTIEVWPGAFVPNLVMAIDYWTPGSDGVMHTLFPRVEGWHWGTSWSGHLVAVGTCSTNPHLFDDVDLEGTTLDHWSARGVSPKSYMQRRLVS